MRDAPFSAERFLVLLLVTTTNAFHQVAPVSSMFRQSLYPSVVHWRNSQQTSARRKEHSTALSAAFSAAILASTVDTMIQSSPYTAAALTCGFKASAADFVAQKRQLRKRNEKTAAAKQKQQSQKTDWKRNLAFLLYGSMYQGIAQEFIYNHVYPILFGPQTTVAIVLCKVAFDLLIQTTLITLPIAYLTKAMIYNYSWKEALLGRYKNDVFNHGLLKKYYLLWGPVQCITFSIIPEHYRVTWIACVSFFWLIILSSISSRTTATAPQKVAKQTPPVVAAAVTEGELLEDYDMSFTEEELNFPDCELADGLTCNVDG